MSKLWLLYCKMDKKWVVVFYFLDDAGIFSFSSLLTDPLIVDGVKV